MSTRSDTGPFCMIPVWVLDLPISHVALRLYAIHADWADRGGEHWHGRKALSERLGCSLDTVDRAHTELVKHRALRVTNRLSDRGDPSQNRYQVCRVHPGVAAPVRLPSRMDAATGSRMDAALIRNKYEQDPPTPHGGQAEPSDPSGLAPPGEGGHKRRRDEPEPTKNDRPPPFTAGPPVTQEERDQSLARLRALRRRGTG